MKKHNVLIVDDDVMVISSLMMLLKNEQNINIITATSGAEAIEIFKKEKIKLVLTDHNMPMMTGIELLGYLKKHYPDVIRILITANVDVNVAIDAINEGSVYSFISKPWKPENLKLMVKKALEYHDLNAENKILMKQIKKQNNELEKKNIELDAKVKERTKQIEDQFYQILQSLTIALEEKDKYTQGHSKRVDEYSKIVANELNLSKKEKEILSTAAKLHDIGKMGIPGSILNKPGKLTDEEFKLIKTHAEKGAKILAPLKGLEEIAEITKMHHERYDGNGYLKCPKEKIPFLSQILIVVDAYDAMTSSRAYRSAMPINDAIEELKRNSGTQFDPKIVEVFVKAIKKKKGKK